MRPRGRGCLRFCGLTWRRKPENPGKTTDLGDYYPATGREGLTSMRHTPVLSHPGIVKLPVLYISREVILISLFTICYHYCMQLLHAVFILALIISLYHRWDWHNREIWNVKFVSSLSVTKWQALFLRTCIM